MENVVDVLRTCAQQEPDLLFLTCVGEWTP